MRIPHPLSIVGRRSFCASFPFMTAAVPVRVAVRVRPLLPSEAADEKQCCVAVVARDQLVLGRDRQFRFDYVFDSTVSQFDLYHTCLHPCVDACLDGYNTTVLAYGQTSSGKSYTMGSEGVGGAAGWDRGGEELDESAGIIPRAMKDLFQQIEKRKSICSGEARQWQVGVSYIEIYREELRDLLDCGVGSQHLVIRDNEQGHTVVVGAREERVKSSEEALNLLFAGNTSRVTEATEMNRRSSRSHAIFTVIVESSWVANSQTPLQENYVCGKFHFVDLAGSERAGKTGNRGDRFKESVHINSGLLALGNVISALADQRRCSSHVPYRDAKITRLLKDSLGGNSRTIMIACLNPLVENFAESLNTLKFAKRARNICNHPVINRDPQTARLHEMEGEIRSLRAELQRVQSTPSIALLPSSTVSSTITTDLHIPSQAEQNVTYTVTQLRRELELCQSDLETDEVLYAEKIDELNEVQSRYDNLVRDSEQLKQLWEAGQRKEETLRREVERLSKRVTELEAMEKEREQGTQRLREKEEEEMKEDTKLSTVEQEGYRLHTDQQVEVGYSQKYHSQAPSEGLPKSMEEREEAEESMPCLQLLKGKVRTDREEDLSDEAVLQSLQTLTSLLAHHHSYHHQHHTLTGPGTRGVALETSSCEPALSKSGTVSPAHRSKLAVECEGGQEEEREEEEGGEGEGEGEAEETELDLLNQSALLSKHQLSETQHKLLDAHNELKDLSIKIKLKEEWVRELVKNNVMAKQLNEMYITQIHSLEQEAAAVQLELRKAQTTLQTQQYRQQESSNVQERIQEQQQKLAEAEKKLAAVQKKHRATQRAMQWGERSGKRVEELEAGLERLRSRQETMRRRLKKHAEMKTKLENEVQMYQQKVQQLQYHSDRQKKVLRVKTQEAAIAQRKLRQMNSHSNTDSTPRVDVSPVGREWLDGEVERILQQKQALQMLEKELAEREKLVREREQVALERAALETKQLHCSQAMSRDLTRLSVQIQSLDSSIRASENGTQEQDTGRSRQCALIARLKKERDRLIEQRSELQERAHNTSLLPAADEKQLVELSEHIEVLEAAIEFKNDAIASRELHSSQILSSENMTDKLCQKLQQMSAAQVRALLVGYVGKVVDLRVAGGRRERERMKMAAECTEKQQTIVNLQRSLKQTRLEVERRLLSQEKEHQQQIQILVQQLATSDSQLPVVNTTSSATPPTTHHPSSGSTATTHLPNSNSAVPTTHLSPTTHLPNSDSAVPTTHLFSSGSTPTTHLPNSNSAVPTTHLSSTPTTHLPNSDNAVPTTHLSSSGSASTSRHGHNRQVESLKSKVKTLEKELYYYKKTSRDLKKKLQGVRLSSTTASTRGSSHNRHGSTIMANNGRPSPITTSTRGGSHKRQDYTDIANECRVSPTTASSSTRDDSHSTATANDGGKTLQTQSGSDSIKRERAEHATRAHTSHTTMSTDIDSTVHTSHATVSTNTDSLPPVCHVHHQQLSSDGSKFEGITQAVTDQMTSDSLGDGGLTDQGLGLVLKSKKQLRQLSTSEIAERLSKHNTELQSAQP